MLWYFKNNLNVSSSHPYQAPNTKNQSLRGNNQKWTYTSGALIGNTSLNSENKLKEQIMFWATIIKNSIPLGTTILPGHWSEIYPFPRGSYQKVEQLFYECQPKAGLIPFRQCSGSNIHGGSLHWSFDWSTVSAVTFFFFPEEMHLGIPSLMGWEWYVGFRVWSPRFGVFRPCVTVLCSTASRVYSALVNFSRLSTSYLPDF